MSPMRLSGRSPPRHRHPSTGPRTVRVAPHPLADHGPSLPVHRVRSCVAPRHHQAAAPRAKISRTGLAWALVGIVCQHLSMARIAEALAVSWNTANDAVLAEGRRLLINDPHRLDGVTVIGVDEHCWGHTRRGDKFVTVIIDLTPVRDGSGPARLLDMVDGRSKQAFKAWLAERDQGWRDAVEVVAMDGFTGFKTATTEELPRRHHRDGPLSRGPAGRGGCVGSVSAPSTTAGPRAPRPQRRSAVSGPTHPAYRCRAPHPPPSRPD